MRVTTKISLLSHRSSAIFLTALCLMFWFDTFTAAALEIEPFRTNNQGPLIAIFGIPAEQSPDILKNGKIKGTFSQEVANTYIATSTSSEYLLLDGESYRWTAALRYGISDSVEVGLDLPLVTQGGGTFDGFIEGWHSFFSLPQGGRNTAARNRISYRYVKNGTILLDRSPIDSGIGDITMNAGLRLIDVVSEQDRSRLSLRASMKLPTGSSRSLHGSGGIDTTLYLAGSINRATEWGTLAIYGSAGGLLLGPGEVIHSQQNRLAAFGTAGLGWSPFEPVTFKTQLNWHTPLYRKSSLPELSGSSAMLIFGGTIKLPSEYQLDIGISEDVAVGTAPDIGLHLALSKRF